MTEPDHPTDGALTIHSLDPVTLGTDDDPLALGSRSPVGAYALAFDVSRTTVEVDALGEHRFPANAYAYVGSAFGTGGLRRIRHHRRVAAGDHDARHWHVDYLGGHPPVDLACIACVTDRDVECAVATELASPLGPALTDGFGSSDCPCDAYLTRGDLVETATPLIEAALRSKMQRRMSSLSDIRTGSGIPVRVMSRLSEAPRRISIPRLHALPHPSHHSLNE